MHRPWRSTAQRQARLPQAPSTQSPSTAGLYTVPCQSQYTEQPRVMLATKQLTKCEADVQDNPAPGLSSRRHRFDARSILKEGKIS